MIGAKPITLADTAPYVSAADPAIDWDRVVAREHELDPDLGARVRAQLSKRMEAAPELTEAAARLELEREAIATRVGPIIRSNPGITLETYVPRAGQQVTVFRVGVVQPAVMARIEDETSGAGSGVPRMHERYWRCFLAGLRGVDNFGQRTKPVMRTVDDVEFVDASWLSTMFVGALRKYAEEVGFVIWAWNRFSEDDAKK